MNAYHDPIALARGFFATKSGFIPALALALGLWLLVWYGNLLAGIASRLSVADRGPMVLLLSIAAYFLVIGGAGSGVRYKLPALPFLLGFAGYNLARVWFPLQRRFRGGA